MKTTSMMLPHKITIWGYFYEKDSLYFYAHNYPTYKNVDILNSSGKVVHSLDVSKLKCESKIKVEIHSLDSIYVLSQEPNTLFLLNKNGDVRKRVAIDSLFYHKSVYTKNKCSYLSVYYYGGNKPMIKNGNLLTNLYILLDSTYRHLQKSQLGYIKNVLDSNSKVKHDNGWINGVIKKEDEHFNLLPFYMFLDDKIVFCISHDRHIYFVNPEDLSFERKIPIYSDYTELEYKKPKITEEPPKTPYVYKAMYKGGIANLWYEGNQYFVLIGHELPLPQKEEMISLPDAYDRRYSIIIYNKQWKKQKEILLPEKEMFVAFLPNKQFITQSKTKNPRQVTLNFYQLTE